MKKILTIALVALFAASSVFAGFSGYSNLAFGYNSKSKALGFSPETKLSVDLDVATADGSKVGEGDIYAGIDASIKLRLVDAKDSSNKVNTYVYSDTNKRGYYGFGVFAFVNDVYIAGKDWKVSFGTASSNPVDFAKSPVDTYKKAVKDAFNTVYDITDTAVSYSAPYASTNGFVATYKDYKVGVGFAGAPLSPEADYTVNDDLDKDGKILLGYTAYVLTPEIALGDATVKAGAIASKAEYVEDTNAKTYSKAYTSAGASLELGYATDVLSAKVAADLGLKNIGKDNAFGFDVAAGIKYDFIALDAYYAKSVTYDAYSKDSSTGKISKTETTQNKLLSAKVVADLAAAEIAPVKLTLTGKNLINKQNLSLSAEVSATDAISFEVGGGYVIADKDLSVSASVKYVAEKFTASAGAEFEYIFGEIPEKHLVPEVVVSSDVLVNGATLELSWKKNTDKAGNSTTDLLNLKTKGVDWGKIYATAKVSF